MMKWHIKGPEPSEAKPKVTFEFKVGVQEGLTVVMYSTYLFVAFRVHTYQCPKVLIGDVPP
jgi:hypothetical protein